MIVWLILLTFLTYIFIWIKKRARFWSDRGFPSGDFIFPYGSLKGIGTEKCLCDGLDYFYKKFKGKGPAVGVFSFTNPFLIPIDPELIRKILVTNFDTFPDRALFYNKEDDPISQHLLALEGKAWKDRRTLLTPTFTSGKMKIMFQTINVVGDQLVTAIEKSLDVTSKLEMHEIICRFTTDSISNVAFGLDSNSLNDDNSEMRKYGKEMTNFGPVELLKFFFTSSFPEISRKMHMTINKKCVIDYFYNTFKMNFEHRETSGIIRKDFVQLLLELKHKHSLTIDELSAEAFIFFLGGFETASNLITFALYELALNQDIQMRLRQEILDAVENGGGKLTYEILFELKYLDMFVKEALRKFPPAYNILRKSRKDFKIPDTDLIIPANTDIQISIYSLHRDPEYFPEPEKFNPERFSPENIDNIKPFTFIPFGDGFRSCIGKRYGLMKSKLGIAKIIQNFEILPCDKTPIEPIEYFKAGLFLNPADHMWLEMRKLNNNN